jgi:segregation and condensation protein A
VAQAGARLAIRLLQDAAMRGEIDPWDVDVISVIDGFLDQLRQRIEQPRLAAVLGGSYEQDLAESSEAFLAASVLVGLKAEVLEASTFPPEPLFDVGDEGSDDPDDGGGAAVILPSRPERHLRRRPVAPPPLQRPVTLGELIRQLEDIAERLENDEGTARHRPRSRRYSERAAIAQVAGLAHREKLPETTAALSLFLAAGKGAARGGEWLGFDDLVCLWQEAAPAGDADDLDRDRVGVFWALLFLCAQGRVDLDQQGGLFGPLRLRTRQESAEEVITGWGDGQGPARGPARELLAA